MHYSTIRTTLFALVAVGLLTLTGCDQTINKTPEQDIPSDRVFTSVSGAQSALNGVYSGLQQNGVYGGFPVIAADFTADNLVFSGSFTTWNNAENFNLTAGHPSTENLWFDHYDAINRANLVIEKTPNVPGIQQAEIDDIVGQAKVLRGLLYFNLVRWFARPYNPGGSNDHPGVILQTDGVESTEPEFNQPRAPVGDVYSQIRADLQDAISRLDPKAPKRAGQGAARALLAKVSLYQGQWQQASDLAEAVISDGTFALSSDPVTPYYTESNPEVVFAVSFSSIDNTGVNDFPTAFYLPEDLGGRGDANPPSDFVTDADAGDVRAGIGSYNGSSLLYSFEGNIWTNKWTEPNLGDDVPVARVAEMYLIRAEAEARMAMAGTGDGTYAQARSDVNTIRNRAGVGNVSGTLSGQALIDEIIRQRKYELAFEGDRRHDLQRLGRTINSGTGTVQPGDSQRLLPIPQREIDVNDALSQSNQNPGY